MARTVLRVGSSRFCQLETAGTYAKRGGHDVTFGRDDHGATVLMLAPGRLAVVVEK